MGRPVDGSRVALFSISGLAVNDVRVALTVDARNHGGGMRRWLYEPVIKEWQVDDPDEFGPPLRILSVGNNSYGHPTAEALARLHAHGVVVYWTETGSGIAPGPGDLVCNGAVTITVSLPDVYAVNCG